MTELTDINDYILSLKVSSYDKPVYVYVFDKDVAEHLAKDHSHMDLFANEIVLVEGNTATIVKSRTTIYNHGTVEI